jgi:integrase
VPDKGSINDHPAVAKTAPIARFTASRVATLPAGSYTDPATTGLQLRVRIGVKILSRTWLFRYRWRGQFVRIMLGHLPEMSLSEAREKALRMRRALDDGIDPRRSESRRRIFAAPQSISAAALGGGHTVDFLVQEFFERHIKPSRKRPEYVQQILDKDVLPTWRGRDARTIKPREVIELLDGIVERGAPVAANRTAAVIGQLFKFGIHRAIVETSPVQLLYRPGGKEKPRERALTDTELEAFLRDPLACTRQSRLAHVITILLLTAQRRGELAAAKWRNIDFKLALWTIPASNSKTGRESLVPLSGLTSAEFRALKKCAGRSQWVLPAADHAEHIDPKLLTRGLAKCLKRFKACRIEAFTLHDLRRTCRTGLTRLKVEPHIAERVLGHAQEKIAGTYDVHDYLDEKRVALEKWAAEIGRIAGTSNAAGGIHEHQPA